MALSNREKAVLTKAVEELEVAKTWVTGPRTAKLGNAVESLKDVVAGKLADAEERLEGNATETPAPAAKAPKQ
jgi:hypothetical protein